MKNYTIEKAPSPTDFDVYFLLKESNQELFRIKNESLWNMYKFFTKNIEQAKASLYHSYPDVSKEAIDFFVEQTYNEKN